MERCLRQNPGNCQQRKFCNGLRNKHRSDETQPTEDNQGGVLITVGRETRVFHHRTTLLLPKMAEQLKKAIAKAILNGTKLRRKHPSKLQHQYTIFVEQLRRYYAQRKVKGRRAFAASLSNARLGRVPTQTPLEKLR